ncbi:hypothetical protein PUNSTDRAFT_138916 [Punctularia strigosozonata HHB-11173 SS5]|uniref:Uncharacterized protein n=1 Tax=Punctularia strigosozonata (strain HHB-11173) TaxID=741275 RepID=R7S1D8_PUNST|nr:uncharacterized protein PUNSTDRAFT_138916 [Punctularia strigosozonata HHB-11173 SS5]EIN04190.1 hypothetical protein PUNSTDRAFT_138916 [Punctularia strigosozonata HHB-11173 SS5]
MSSSKGSSVVDLVPIFNGTNFVMWEQSMKAYLMQQGLWHIINDARPDTPASGDEEAVKIAKEDRQRSYDEKSDKALGSILLRVSESIRQTLKDQDEPDKVLDLLRRNYGQQRVGNAYSDFVSMQRVQIPDDKSPVPALNELQACWDRLQQIKVRPSTGKSSDPSTESLPKWLFGMMLLSKLPKNLEVVRQNHANTDPAQIDPETIRTAVISAWESNSLRKRSQPPDAKRITAIKKKNGDKPFDAQLKNNRDNNSGSSGSNQQSSGSNNKKRGKRGGNKKKNHSQHTHIADVDSEDGMHVIASGVSHIASVASVPTPGVPGPTDMRMHRPVVKSSGKPSVYRDVQAGFEIAHALGIPTTSNTLRNIELDFNAAKSSLPPPSQEEWHAYLEERADFRLQTYGNAFSDDDDVDDFYPPIKKMRLEDRISEGSSDSFMQSIGSAEVADTTGAPTLTGQAAEGSSSEQDIAAPIPVGCQSLLDIFADSDVDMVSTGHVEIDDLFPFGDQFVEDASALPEPAHWADRPWADDGRM